MPPTVDAVRYGRPRRVRGSTARRATGSERVGPERAEAMFASMRWMAGQGVRFIAGTDAGIPRATFDSL